MGLLLYYSWYQYWWRQTDGDSDHYELRDGEFFDDDTPKGWGDVGFIGMPNSITVIDGFGYNMGSNGATWSNYDLMALESEGSDNLVWIHADSQYQIHYTKPWDQLCYRTGEVGTRCAPLTYGVRNPAANNFGVFDPDDGTVNGGEEPIYDNGLAHLIFLMLVIWLELLVQWTMAVEWCS